MSEQITSGTIELTAPRLERTVNVRFETTSYGLEEAINAAIRENTAAGWELAAVTMTSSVTNDGDTYLYAALTFEREVQP